MTKNSTGNIILLPHLFERYVELALEARKSGDYQTAKEHLEQALFIRPDDDQAMVPLLLTYHDLGLHQEAQLLAGEMLQKGYGEFVDIFRLYLISLIQLERYEEACETVSLILEEQTFSPPVTQEFQQILETCKMLVESTPEGWDEERLMLSQAVQDKLECNPEYLTKLIQELTMADFDRQLQVIEQLKYIDSPQSIGALKGFLIDKEADPVLKTFVLGALKELGVPGEVEVYKGGKKLAISIDLVPHLEEGLCEPERSVADLVTQKTYHRDPMFSSFALQIWVEFFYAAYPFHPPIKKTEAWAAALHLTTERTLGQNPSVEEIAELYHVSSSSMVECLQAMDSILNLQERLKRQMTYFPRETD